MTVKRLFYLKPNAGVYVSIGLVSPKDSSSSYVTTFIQTDNKKEKEHKRLFRLKIKEAVIKEFGGKCIICGITDNRILVLNHLHDGNKEWSNRKHRRRSNSFTEYYYGLLLKEDVDLRCLNCNWIYEYETGRLVK